MRSTDTNAPQLFYGRWPSQRDPPRPEEAVAVDELTILVSNRHAHGSHEVKLKSIQ